MSALPPEFAGMSPEEKLELIELLWESIPDTAVPVPGFHREIIKERLEDLRQNPNGGKSLEEFVTIRTRQP